MNNHHFNLKKQKKSLVNSIDMNLIYQNSNLQRKLNKNRLNIIFKFTKKILGRLKKKFKNKKIRKLYEIGFRKNLVKKKNEFEKIFDLNLSQLNLNRKVDFEKNKLKQNFESSRKFTNEIKMIKSIETSIKKKISPNDYLKGKFFYKSSLNTSISKKSKNIVTKQNFCKCKLTAFLAKSKFKNSSTVDHKLKINSNNNLSINNRKVFKNQSNIKDKTNLHDVSSYDNNYKQSNDNLSESYSFETDSSENDSSTIENNEGDFFEVYSVGSASFNDNPISVNHYTNIIINLTNKDLVRKEVLKLCDQKDALNFESEFSKEKYKAIISLDSGSFASAFLAIDRNNNIFVFKLIRSVSKDLRRLNQINFSGVETFDEIYNELIISKALSSLHNSDANCNVAHCFPKIFFSKLVRGKIPESFLINEKLLKTEDLLIKDLKNNFHHFVFENNLNSKYKKEFLLQEPFNMFPDAPIEYTVIAMKYAGVPIRKFLSQQSFNENQFLSISKQLIFGLACAEEQFRFEHRDLHTSNILVKPTKKKIVNFKIKGKDYFLPTYGYRCFIVDNTFSRLSIDNHIFYRNLQNLFDKNNDKNTKNIRLEDTVYHSINDEVNGEWNNYFPRTNLFWLIYFFNVYKTKNFRKNGKIPVGNELEKIIEVAAKCHTSVELMSFVVEKNDKNYYL